MTFIKIDLSKLIYSKNYIDKSAKSNENSFGLQINFMLLQMMSRIRLVCEENNFQITNQRDLRLYQAVKNMS